MIINNAFNKLSYIRFNFSTSKQPTYFPRNYVNFSGLIKNHGILSYKLLLCYKMKITQFNT